MVDYWKTDSLVTVSWLAKLGELNFYW